MPPVPPVPPVPLVPAGAARAVTGGGKQLGQVDARTIGQLVELRTAGEPVGENDRAGGGRPYRRQQRRLGHRDRHVVVPALDAEVAGQPAAPADRLDRRTGPLQQRRVGRPTHHRVVMAVRLRDRPDTREVGQVQPCAR